MTDGRVVLITGAAGGIGRRLAERLHAEGHALWLTDRDLSLLRKETGHLRQVSTSALDVRDPEAWRALVAELKDRFGRLDVLFNVAGFMRAGALTESDDALVDAHLDVNAKGVIHGTRAAARLMVRQGHGHIVNVASLMGVAPIPGFALYSASKHAVRGFSIAAALELRAQGVFVSVVCPDAVQTAMLDAQVESDAARIAFSGPRPLSVDEVVNALAGPVLRDKPIELTLAPRGSARGLLSKVVALAPALAVSLEPVFGALGAQRQARAREKSRTRS